MFSSIETYCDNLKNDFKFISEDRKNLLDRISVYIRTKKQQSKPVNLVYICTHNSRRSQLGQVWAKAAADYYNIKNINSFSGGTEATAFNLNAINALKRIGFEVKTTDANENPVYEVFYDSKAASVICFSKISDDDKNPKTGFAAIMTCSEAEKNCPFVPGSELRISTAYDDPKAFDGTPLQDLQYDERCKQIALETLYIFSRVDI